MPAFTVNYRVGDQDMSRPWGSWQTLDVGNLLSRGGLVFCDKRITVNPQGRLSIQRHDWREEFWRLDEKSAAAILYLGATPERLRRAVLQPGQEIHIPARAWHSLHNPHAVNPVILHEKQIGPILDEGDNHRFPTKQDPRTTDKIAIARIRYYARAKGIEWPSRGRGKPTPSRGVTARLMRHSL